MNPARRRLVSGGASALLVVIGLIMLSTYVIETAGPAIDVAGKHQGKQLITLSGAKTYTSPTKLFVTTVSSYGTTDNGVLSAQAFASLFASDMQAVPVRALYSKNETSSDVDKRNAAFMTDSQGNVAVVVLGKTGHTIMMKLVVAGMPKSSHASGKFAKGDVLTSISAVEQKTEIRTYSDLVQRLVKIALGTTVAVGLTRDGKEKMAEIVTAAYEADATGQIHPSSKLGVYLSNENLRYLVKVNYGIEQIKDPSAGLIFSLAVYDDLTPDSPGDDKVIAGTGTMSMGGDVGPTGGIQHRLVGALQKEAKHFLASAKSCAEMIGYEPKGVKVYSVRTFDEAVKAVQAIGTGETLGLQTCHDVVAKSPKR